MKKILECIPNFSEGRNKKIIQAIAKSISSISNVIILNLESDSNHNRSVITFAGGPEAVIKGAFQACKTAAKLINMNKHHGVHPCMGSTDVIPLVPIQGISEIETIKLAKKLGKRLGTELKIPVYLYEKSATRPERRNLSNIRNDGYKTIKKEIAKNPSREPDFGPKKLGKAGAVAVGVREPLIAYNINLASSDIKIARKIASKIRERDGGLPFVKALGFKLGDRNIVQISTNLTNYKVTPPHRVFKAVEKEAYKYRIKIPESEIIGLIPKKALKKNDEKYLKLKNFNKDKILENALDLQNPRFSL